MKNLIAYHLGTPSRKAEIETYLRLQVENSLQLGWRPEDVIVKTNFPFSHLGVESSSFECEGKATFSKWYAIRDVLSSGHPVWNHDHDGWQLHAFPSASISKPFKARVFGWVKFEGRITPLVTTNSIFIRPDALPFVHHIIEYEASVAPVERFGNDEYVIAHYLSSNLRLITNFDTSLSLRYCYNAPIDHHYIDALDLPLCYLHCKFGRVPTRYPSFRLDIPDRFRRLTKGFFEFKDD
jgi:hypothetical protein